MNHSSLHGMVMLDHIDQKLEQGRKDLKRYRENGASGYLGACKEKQPEEPEDMRIVASGNVYVGDLTGPKSEPSPPPALSTLAKAGIAAALIASGFGAGAAIPLAISALSRPAEVVREVEAKTQTETVTDWRDYQIGEIIIREPGQ